ncbi:hypothetical protein BD324DRAFT_582039, partial [Kockovaella imperatae]
CCPPQKDLSGVVKSSHPHPVSESSGYELKGTYEKLGGFEKVYVTGPDDAKHALVVIYDIFGFWETTLRGADLLVSHLLLTRPTKIFMPDVYRGKPFPFEKDGDKDELQKFFAGTAKLSDRLPEVIAFGEYLNKEYESVAIQGYCWGGKVTLMALSSTLPSQTPFCCGAVVHPALIAPEDGDNLAAPLGFYPSHDEPKEAVEKIEAAMEIKEFVKKCDYHLYDTVHHGWAAARANLKDSENLKQYEDVYQRLADYYSKQC